MPRVSKRKLDAVIETSIVDILNEGVGDLDKDRAAEVLKALLTPEERLMLAKRIAAVMLLKAGYSYKKLELILKIVPATTNQIKRRVRANQKVFRNFTNDLERHQITRDFYQRARQIVSK